MTAAQPPHTLIVTRDPDDRHPFDYRVECPAVTDDCRSWLECDDCPTGLDEVARDEYDDAMGDNDGLAHGVQHQHLDGAWARATDDCYVEYAINRFDDAPAQDLGIAEPGRYPVTFGYEGEYVTLTLATAGATS